MGIISSSVRFLLGTTFGVYIVQNYDIPKIKQLIDEWIYKVERFERDYRKSEKAGD